METTINVVEKATNLAHNALLKDFSEALSANEDVVWDFDNECYTEEAQKVFDDWYDYYYNELIKKD